MFKFDLKNNEDNYYYVLFGRFLNDRQFILMRCKNYASIVIMLYRIHKDNRRITNAVYSAYKKAIHKHMLAYKKFNYKLKYTLAYKLDRRFHHMSSLFSSISYANV